MKKSNFKRITATLLLILLVTMSLPFSAFAANTTYAKIVLDENFVTKYGIGQHNPSDCAIASMATIEAYLLKATDKTQKESIYNGMWNLNNKKPSAVWATLGYSSGTSFSLEELYRQLSKGIPVIVHRANHYSVVYAYTGPTNKLEASGFQVCNVKHGPAVDKQDLKSWGNGTLDAINYRLSSTPATLIGTTFVKVVTKNVSSVTSISASFNCSIGASSAVRMSEHGIYIATSLNSIVLKPSSLTKAVCERSDKSVTRFLPASAYQVGSTKKYNGFEFLPNRTYYYCAYAVINSKLVLGEVKSFTTKDFKPSVTKLNKTMTVSSVNGTGTAPAHTEPYGGAKITNRYTAGQKVTVVGQANNAYGNKWFKLSDGTWMVSGYLK